MGRLHDPVSFLIGFVFGAVICGGIVVMMNTSPKPAVFPPSDVQHTWEVPKPAAYTVVIEVQDDVWLTCKGPTDEDGRTLALVEKCEALLGVLDAAAEVP